MDHLPAPAHPTGPLPEVPYLCEDDPYDGGAFLTYTTRQGVPQLSSVDDAVLFRAWERNHPIENQELEEILQTWLFFGLLHEVLDKHGLFHDSDYIESNKAGVKLVHTKHLRRRLRSWTDIVRSEEQSEKDQELQHLCACLRLAHQAHYLILDDHHANCNRAIVWSIAIILETVASAVNLAFIGPERQVTIAVWKTEFDDAETSRMIHNGWCIHEILCAQKELESNAGRFYIQRLRKPSLGLDHSGCDTDNCKRLQIDLPTYQPRHMEEACKCPWSGPAPREVARCLEKRTFPVLRITGYEVGKIKAEVVPYVDGMVYIALSHVWADGLGNPMANRLPQCQLLRLRKLADDIRNTRYLHIVDESVKEAPESPLVYPDEYQEMFIWCDTICCPVQDAANPFQADELAALQSKAIARLRQVYESASYVLVLDRGLERIDFQPLDRVEVGVRVFTSRWVRRVWTFQEGGIAERLLISFRDAIVDFRTIWGALHHDAADRPEAHTWSQRRALVTHCFNLRSWFNKDNATMDYRGPIWSLCWRRVSVAADEALCLAAAYNLNAEAVAAQPRTTDARMQEVWRQLAASSQGISAFIIFNGLPRLPGPGFRWAPSSILQTVKNDSILEFVFRNTEDSKGTLTPCGFRVNFPGWRIRPSGPPGQFPRNLITTNEPNTHYLRDARGAWFSVWEHKDLHPDRNERLNHLWDENHEDNSGQWHIILDICPSDQETFGRRGLVTLSQAPEPNFTIQQSEMVVWAKRLAPQWELLWESVFSRIHPLRHDPKIEAISSFALQGFSINDAWARVFVDMSPTFTYVGSEEPTPQALYDLCRELILQIHATWEAAGKDEQILEALRIVHGGEEELGHVVKSVFMGRIAHIDEDFDEETAWCVDCSASDEEVDTSPPPSQAVHGVGSHS